MFFSSDEEVVALAGLFYRRSLPLSKWDKPAQLAITLYYVLRFPYRMAFEMLRERVPALMAVSYRSEKDLSELDSSIHDWLQTAKRFAQQYQNIEELSALTNIFIATHWKSDAPYEQNFDKSFFDAETARLVTRPFSDEEPISCAMGATPLPLAV